MRKKILSLLLVATTFAYGGMINAIALTINDEPITLYDIDKLIQERSFSKAQAIEFLVDKTIYNQEIKKNNITVDIFDIDNYIAQLAEQNKMNILDFKSLIRQQQDYGQFEEKIKEQLLHQKLVRKIAAGNIKIASEDDILIYYENNKEQFTLPDQIDVVVYISKNKPLLEQIQKNPMTNSSEVITQNLSLNQNELLPQIKYIINTTPTDSFSPIFTQNQQYNMFYIKEKKDIKTLSLEEAREGIFQKIMEQREKAFLVEYFETRKITAEVKVLR